MSHLAQNLQNKKINPMRFSSTKKTAAFMAANMSGSAEPSTSNLSSQKITKLIAFDKEKKIRYFGPCTYILINAAARCLILTTNSTVKNLKEVASTFNRTFIQKENALCVIDDGITNKNFMIIFSTKELCNRIFEVIMSAKYSNITPPPMNDSCTEDYLFKNNFYLPILKEIKQQIPGFKEIKTTILDLVNSFEAFKRQSYMNIVFKILVFSTASSDENEIAIVQDSTVSSNTQNVVDRKSTVSSNVEIFLDDGDTINEDDEESIGKNRTSNGILNSTNPSLKDSTNSGYGIRKRSRPNYVEMESFESNEMGTDMATSTAKKSRVSIPTVINESTDENQACSETQMFPNVISADYEFVDCFSKGAVRNRLIIFSSKERNQYYEFYYSAKQEWHACKNCTTKKSPTYIKIISAQNGKMEFYFGKQILHVCEPVKYSPENFVINEKMNLLKIDNTENLKRLSEKRQSGVSKVIKSTDFQFVEAIDKQKKFQKLIIFDENDRSLCRDYSSCGVKNSKKHYRCRDCRKKHNHHVAAYFIKSEDNGNNGDIVELGLNEHLCQPKHFP